MAQDMHNPARNQNRNTSNLFVRLDLAEKSARENWPNQMTTLEDFVMRTCSLIFGEGFYNSRWTNAEDAHIMRYKGLFLLRDLNNQYCEVSKCPYFSMMIALDGQCTQFAAVLVTPENIEYIDTTGWGPYDSNARILHPFIEHFKKPFPERSLKHVYTAILPEISPYHGLAAADHIFTFENRMNSESKMWSRIDKRENEMRVIRNIEVAINNSMHGAMIPQLPQQPNEHNQVPSSAPAEPAKPSLQQEKN